MGEAYRGLTIRFGAETSNLKKALTTVNSAVSQTERMLRQVNKGLKFDPTSLSMLGLKAENTSKKIGALGQKLEYLKREEQELARLKGVDSLANSMENANALAAKAKSRYNELNEQLAVLRKSVKSLAEENKVAFDPDNIILTINSLKRAGVEVTKLRSDYRELVAARRTAFDQNELYKNVVTLQKNRIEQSRLTAEIKESAKAVVELNKTLRSSGANSDAFKKISSEIEHMRQTSKLLTGQMEALEKAMKIDPSNFLAAENHAELLGQKTNIARQIVEQLEKQLAELGKQGFGKAVSSMEQLINAERAASNEAVRLEARQRELIDITNKYESEIKELLAVERAGNADATASIRTKRFELAAAEKELRDVKASLEGVYQTIDKVRGETAFKTLKNDIHAARAEATSLEHSMAAAGKTFNVTNSNLKNLGITLQMAVAPALYQIGFRSIEAADRIDSSFRNMKKTVDGTAEDFDHLRKAAIQFSETHITSADTILEIEAMGGQLGIAVDQLETFAKVASDLDIATDLDAETISKQLGQLSNIMGFATEDMERYGNALVRLGNNMPAQESAISNITMRIASMASILGMTTDETLAWSAALAATGQGSEAAGTAFSRTMADIEKAVGEGGEAVQAFADVAGMSAEELSYKWGNGGVTEVLRAFIQGLVELDANSESVTNKLDELGMSGVRQMQAVEGLTTTIDTLDDALTMSKDAWNGVDDQWGKAGDAAREAAQKSEGFSGALGMLKNAASAFGDTLGTAFVPYMVLARDSLVALRHGFEMLPQPIQTVMVGLLGVAATSGTVLTVYSTVSEVFGKSGKDMDTAGRAAMSLGQRLAGAGDSAKKFGSNILGLATSSNVLYAAMGALVAVGVAGVIAAWVDYDKKISNVRKATDGLKQSMLSISASAAKASYDVNTAFSSEAFDTSIIDELIEKQAKLASSISSRNKATADSISLTQQYGQKMADLIGITDDSGSSLAELELAVKGFNEQTGRNIELVKTAAGDYEVYENGVSLTKDAIYKLIEAEQAEAVAKAAAENYKDLYAQEQENVRALTEAKVALIKAQEEYNKALETGNGDLIRQAERNLGLLQEKYDRLAQSEEASADAMEFAHEQMILAQEAMKGNADGVTTWLAANTRMQTALESNGQSLLKFRDKLVAAGVSAEDLGKLGEEGIVRMATAFDGNISSIRTWLDGLGVAYDEEMLKELEDNEQKAASQEAATERQNAAIQAAQDKLIEMQQTTDVTTQDVMDALSSMAASSEMSLGDFIQWLDTTGVNVEDFKSLNREQLSQVVEAYNSGEKDISASLKEMSRNTKSETDSAKDSLNQLNDSNFQMETWGSHLSEAFARGLDFSGAIEKARQAANAITGLLGHSVPKEGPLRNGGKGEAEWGLHLAQNFAQGMEQGMPYIEKQTDAIATMLSNNMSGLAYTPDMAKNASAAARNVASYAGLQNVSNVYNSGGDTFNFEGITINAKDRSMDDVFTELTSYAKRVKAMNGRR